MSEAANDTPSTDGDTSTQEATGRKKGQRKPIFVLIPKDIDNLDAVDTAVPPSPEPDADGKRPNVEAVSFAQLYHVYAVPAGPGQKRAVKGVLKAHNVDLRNIGRVRMFTGQKIFKIETQYNIRW